MPGGMTGFDLIGKARDVRCGLKALVTSGMRMSIAPALIVPDVPLLLKPYRRTDLAKCIRRALDQVDAWQCDPAS